MRNTWSSGVQLNRSEILRKASSSVASDISVISALSKRDLFLSELKDIAETKNITDNMVDLFIEFY